MATTENSIDVQQLSDNVKNMKVDNKNYNDNNNVTTQENGHSSDDMDLEAVKSDWGFELPELYKLVVKFYKEQSGKALQLTYSERCQLVALSQQVSHGPFDASSPSSQNLGIMDVVGRDRRVAWQALGNMSANAARLKFIEEMHRLAPLLKPYIEACHADHLHQLQLEKEKQEEEERKRLEEEQRQEQLKKEEEERKQQEQTKREIQAALNQQTYAQFRAYAEHQFPDNPEQQGVLIRQLQEQHYQQYMQQVYQQQLQKHQQQAFLDQQQLQSGIVETSQDSDTKLHDSTSEKNDELSNKNDEEDEDIERPDCPEASSIASAAMWTRRDVKEFKAAVQQEGPNTVLRVGHGETVTVRVPTHQDGSCLFWEFATDAYDIGFGLYFEWTDDADTSVTVHVTESDEEDEDEEEEDEENDDDSDDYDGGDDIERGMRNSSRELVKSSPSPPQTVIIPVFRRDCHEEVYAGSHTYPGTGVYLLKFDNSYSLWRSKTLYYRVYYTQ